MPNSPYHSYFLRLAPLLLLGAVSFGCLDSANGAHDETSLPNVGSVYSMTITHTVLGSSELKQSKLDVTLRVADMIFDGKEHVAQFSADTMISLIAYEANGDLSIYLRSERIGPCVVDGQWLRLPFRGTDSVSHVLTSSIPDSFSDTLNGSFVRWTARPAGVERVIVQGKEIESRKVEGRLAVYTDPSDGTIPEQSREYAIWYAPDLGYAVRETLVSLVHTRDGEANRADTLGSSTRELTGYQLK